ncbi:MAG: alpha/beta hydrolase fold domain-containing protein [Gammaproteobacteria bacterium]|nr:alpha/beta hydrolase fold domain-containing protein [Gammaproteobacteria bacterium]
MSDNPIICTCENITRQQASNAIKAGHNDFRSLRRELNIAAQCGHCHRPIKQLLRQILTPTIRSPMPLTKPAKRHFPMPWKHFSHAKLEQEYSPSTCVDDIMIYIQQYIDDSKAAKEHLQHHANLDFGDKRCQGLDYFPGLPNMPLVIYIHGGYWQELSKDESCFMAPSLNAKGYHLVVIDYTLAPQASIHTMIKQCCQAITWIKQQKWPVDAKQIILSGSSAGAHLAACVLGAAAREQHGLTRDTFNQAILFSGIYDLRPLINTYVNAPLKLDTTQAETFSPGLKSSHHFPPCKLVWGDHETSEFKRQSQHYGNLLLADDIPCECLQIPGRNHFDVVYELASLIAH